MIYIAIRPGGTWHQLVTPLPSNSIAKVAQAEKVGGQDGRMKSSVVR